jgi:hypothetical protein
MYPKNWTRDEESMLCQEEREIRSGSMSTQRKQDSAEFKARVALEALQGLKTVHEFASPDGVHPPPMAHGQHRLHQEMSELFSARRAKREQDQEALQAQCYQQSGQLKVELDWLKNQAGLAT